jgi:hypothetical protein
MTMASGSRSRRWPSRVVGVVVCFVFSACWLSNGLALEDVDGAVASHAIDAWQRRRPRPIRPGRCIRLLDQLRCRKPSIKIRQAIAKDIHWGFLGIRVSTAPIH